MLKRGDKTPIMPVQVQLGVVEKTVLVYFVFPKSDAIVLGRQGRRIYFEVGPMEFKKKFKLADMVMDGKLTL
jgi:hypothetical protein